MKNRISSLFIIFAILCMLFPQRIEGAERAETIVFALASRVVLIDGEAFETEEEPYLLKNKIYIPQEIASEYVFNTDKDICAYDLAENGYGIYESEEYGFLAIGDVSGITAENEEDIIKNFGIYVSPDGSDENSGYPLAPVKSLEAARDIYRSNKYPVYVHAGIYRRDKSFELSSSDNGISIKAFGDGGVFIRGSVKLIRSGFKKTTDENFLQRLPKDAVGKVYEYSLAESIPAMSVYPDYMPLQSGIAYYELFSGGIPQISARWPNNEYALTGNVDADGITFEVNSKRLEKWENTDYGMVCGYFAHNWSFENIYIGDIDAGNGKLTLARKLKMGDKVLKKKRFYVMNMPEEMDMPGEYYIDCEKRILYYYPDNHFLSEDPELSVLTEGIIKINHASDVRISGLTFEYTRGTAIDAVGDNISIDSCVFRNIGSKAVSVTGLRNIVENCEIKNIGSIGIDIISGENVSLTEGGSIARNNNIYNFGRIFKTYQPAIFLRGVGNIAEFNTIHDAPHCAIRFTGSDNIISHNEIYDVVLEGSDSSAVYCGRNWTYWGNEISYNYFHDIKKQTDNDVYTVSAIYMDDMLCGTKVKNNYFEDCSRAMFFGGGKGNEFSGNIVVNCDEALDYDNRAVTGEWAKAETVPGTTSEKSVYDVFVEFINDEKFQENIWNEKYAGFSQLVLDVTNYSNDISEGKEEVTETGYPKNVTITDNEFYGDNINDEDYIFISPYVYTYGNVSGNVVSEDIPQINIPENGADERLWSGRWYVNKPEKNAVITTGDIEFTWMHMAGVREYDIIISDSDGNEVLRDTTIKNGYNAKLTKKGEYSWSVTAKGYGTEESFVEQGQFTVTKDSFQKGTYIAGNDFDEIENLQALTEQGWEFQILSGDTLTLEKDSTGNGYLKMIRSEDNFYNISQTYAKLKFPKKENGKITVTYDIMIDNFRGVWRDMGSLKTVSEQDIVRLFNHYAYFYGVKTTGAVTDRYAYNMNNISPDSYATIKRTVDLDNNTYELWIYQNDVLKSYSGTRNCLDGEAGYIVFAFGYQAPYEPYAGSGDAAYRIDNLTVDMGEISPEYTYPENDSENVDVNDTIKIKWNDDIDIETVDKNNVIVYEKDIEVSKEDYTVTADKRNIYINFPEGMSYNSEYRIELLNTIEPDSLTHTAMEDEYNFTFKTKSGKNEIYFAQGFEECKTGTFIKDKNIECYVTNGDTITVEDDEYGSRALKLVRNKENLESTTSSYVKINIDPISEGIITVAFDVRMENYRGGVKNFGTVRDSKNNTISSLFTHSSWIYGMITTTGYNFRADQLEKYKYITVKRQINIDEGTYNVWIYKDGNVISSAFDKPCEKGEISEIFFEMGYQAPYTVTDGEDDAVYWIDNIRIDTDYMGTYKCEPTSYGLNESISDVKFVFNCDIDATSIGYDTVKVYKYSNALAENQYDISVCGNILYITLDTPLKNGAGLIVKLSDKIRAKNVNTIKPISAGLTFEFDTTYRISKQINQLCDFEDWEDFSITGPGTFNKDGWTFVLYDGDSICIERDPITDSNAMRITKGSTSSQMRIYCDYSVSENNLIRIKFDTRLENHSRRIYDWGSILGSDETTFLKLFLYKDGLWHDKIGDTKKYIQSLSDKPTRVESILNAKAGNYTVKTYREGKNIAEKSDFASSNVLPERLLFSIGNVQDNYTGTATGEGVYWIDNVIIEEWDAIDVLGIESDNSYNINILFDKEINKESIVKGNIRIYDNGKRMTDYTLKEQDDSGVILTLSEKLTGGHTYILEVSGVTSSEGISMLYKYTYNINPNKVFNILKTEEDQEKVNISIESNIEKYLCIIANKDSSGHLFKTEILECEKDEVLEIEKDENTTVYFWESFSGMNALSPAVFL